MGAAVSVPSVAVLVVMTGVSWLQADALLLGVESSPRKIVSDVRTFLVGVARWDDACVAQDDPDYPSAHVDGFTLGMFVSYDDCGDAWVEAPDGAIGTLIWETGEPAYVEESMAPTDGRWGTYAVQLPLPLTTDEEAAAYLAALLPELRPRWEAWSAAR